jgi:V-type H+-transporting ATPase subunit H
LTKALNGHSDAYAPFLPLLAQATTPEEAIPLLTSTVLTTLLSQGAVTNPNGTGAADKALPKLYTYLTMLAKTTDSGLQDIAVTSYSALLRSKRTRELFWQHRKETVEPLVALLRKAAGVTNGDASSTLWSGASVRGVEGSINGGIGIQLLYHTLLVFWQLSFEGADVGDEMEE